MHTPGAKAGDATDPAMGSKPPLKAANLVKVYPNAPQPALRNLDLTVGSGEIYGLLGPNGAGKTTAISIMSAGLLPTEGSVEIYGWDVIRHRSRVKQMIGLVPQDIAIYPDLTARENLSYFGTLYGLKGAELADRIVDALALVGLTAKADQVVKHYSGGMKRRVNLAAGILHTPRLVFLDEPTVGIDAQSRNLILEKLSVLKDSGTTMIYTTHYMEEAQQLCTRAAVMDEGRVIEEGPPATLMEKHPDCRNLGELFLKLTGKNLRD